MIVKAMITEMTWTVSGSSPPKRSNRGPSRPAKAGSPIQPRAREDSVMPSWQADR